MFAYDNHVIVKYNMTQLLFRVCHLLSTHAGMTYPKQQLGKLPPKPRRPETDPCARQAALHAANIQQALAEDGDRENFHIWGSQAQCDAGAKLQVGSTPITSIAVSIDSSQVLVGCANGDLTTLPSSLLR